MNNRGRYPPGIGLGRGNGGVGLNSGFQPRPPQQQYVQRHVVQHQHPQQYQQHQQNQHHHQQQQQQQQQWLRRTQLVGGSTDNNVVEEVEKTVQSEAVDSRWYFDLLFVFWYLLVVFLVLEISVVVNFNALSIDMCVLCSLIHVTDFT